MKRILWITPRWPEPANDGAKIATLALLKHLPEHEDLEVTLLAILPSNEDAAPVTNLKLKRIQVIKRKASQRSPALRFLLNPLLPVTFSTFVDDEIRAEAIRLASEVKWDAIIFDGVHAALPFLKQNSVFPRFSFPTNGSSLYYRAHNVEWSLWEQAANASPFFKKLALRLQAFLVKKFEDDLIRQCKQVFPVSEDDAARFKVSHPAVSAPVLQIGQNFPKEPPRPRLIDSEIHLGFIGRIDWLPNHQGLEWFLKEVWGDAFQSNPRLRLSIAGSGNADWLKIFQGMPGIKFLGKVPEVDSFYQNLDALIVPLFMGSGTRVKVIEASRYGRVCLSTALGVEGCSLQDQFSYLNAENRSDWLQLLAHLDRENLHLQGKNAFLKLRENYDSRAIASRLVKLL